MTKRGRPKLNRPAHDYGTAELILKRMQMAPKDATQSTTPLDVLYSRETISQEAHSAAVYFVALRKLTFGKAHTPAIDLTAVSRGGAPEVDEKAAIMHERKYRDACAAIKRFGARTFSATEDLLVHERWPDWIRLPHSAHWERRLVLLGIAALLGWYRGERAA